MQPRIVVVCVVLVASVIVGVAAGSSVGAEPNQPSIAFISDRGGQQEPWTVGIDGTAPRRVISDVGLTEPTWTSDGSRLVLQSSGRVLAVGADGSSRVELSPAFGSVVSPDGSAVAFLSSEAGCSYPDAGCELVLARTDGSVRRRLVEQASGAVAWSPDGRQVAYGARAGETDEVWRAAADGTGAMRLLDGLPGVQSLAWLADGRLVLVVGRDIAPHTFLYRPGDAAPTPLQEFACGDTCWVESSPDGSRFFVFSSGSGSPQHLRVFDLAATEIASVLSGKLGWPTWSPDSGTLVYGYCDFSLGQMPPGPCDVERLDLVGGTRARLLPGPEAMPLGSQSWYGGASWAPDGSRLVVSSLDESGKVRLKVLAPDGGSIDPIPSGANDTQPAWQPQVPTAPPVQELAPDPGFESDPTRSWRTVHERGGRATFGWTTDPVHGGTHAVLVSSSRSSTSLARWITSGRIEVGGGQALRFETWLKAVRVAGSGRIDMTFFDRNGVYLPGSAVSSADSGQVVSGTRDWTRLGVATPVPRGATSVRLEIRLYGTGTLFADDVSLTAG